MESVREAWTDERLDHLSNRMDEGFRDVRAELRGEIGSVREEVNEMRKDMNTRLGSVDSRLDAVNARLDGVQQALIYGVVCLSTAMLGGLVAIATQL
jgi:hypothetical protein